MSANQPAQPTASMKFLYHTLLSFGVGILLAVLAAIGNYIYTAGNAIDLKVVLSVGGAAFLAYLLSHFKSDIQPNWAQISQGISDVLTQSVQQSVMQSVQNAHAPLYTAVGQLQQQVAQTAVQVAQVSAQTIPPPQIAQSLPISQLPTQDMPVVIAPQPWQPPDPSVKFGDTGVVPAVVQGGQS